MISFAINSLKFNKKKYVILSLLSMVGFSFIYFILQVLGYFMEKEVKSGDNSFIILMVAFIFIFILCVYMSISIVIYIFYKMRKNEIYILKTLGTSKKKIKKIYIQELAILSLIISIFSFCVGLVLTNIFFYYYEVDISINLLMLLLFFIISNSIFIFIGSRQLKTVYKEITGKAMKKKKKSNYIAQAIIGMVFIISASFTGYNEITAITLLIGIGIITNPVIFFIIKMLTLLFELLKIPYLSVSLKQVTFNFKKIAILTKNIGISIALIIMMFTLYNSLTNSGIQYSLENMKFDSLIQSEYPVLDSIIDNDEVFNGLSFKGEIIKSNKEIIVAGINEEYLKYETLDFKMGSLLDLKSDSNEIPCIIPELLAINNGLTIGDIVEIRILGKKVQLKIVGSIYTYNLSEIYVSKDVISKSILNTSGISNVFYVKGDEGKVTDELSKNSGSNFNIISRETLINEYEDGILNGTEMVETFLYVYLVISIFLIINMFLMSLEEKSRYNGCFKTLGLRKYKIILMNIIEGVITIILGSLIGVFIGGILISGLPDYTLLLYGVRLSIYIPTKFLINIILIAQTITILSVVTLSLFIVKDKSAKLIGKEE